MTTGDFHHLFPSIHPKIDPTSSLNRHTNGITNESDACIHQVHAQFHIDQTEEVSVHDYHNMPSSSLKDLWSTLSSADQSSKQTSRDQSQSSPKQEEKQRCRKPKCSTIIILILVLCVVIVVIVLLALYIRPPPSNPDDNPSKECKMLPPSFGNDCQYRCHCLNLTEFCDKTTGRCKSGCMHGWLGENCQIISSIFDKTTIKANPHSKQFVTCSIYNLWYNWTYVYLTFHNGTKMNTLVNISNKDVISVSDQRLNATLQKRTRIEDPNNVSFVFEFGEKDCDLQGMYKCQFSVVENFNSYFAGLSLLVEDRPNITEFVMEDYYYSISNHSLICKATFANNSTNDIKLQVCQNNSYNLVTNDPVFTQRLSSNDKAHDKCTHQKTVSYTFDFAKVSNGTSLRCFAVDQTLNISVATACFPLVLRSPDIKVEVEPTHQMKLPKSTAEILCHANVSNYKWKAVHLDYANGSTTQRILSILSTDLSPIYGNNVTATVISRDEFVNVSFVLRLNEDVPNCNVRVELSCSIEFQDETLDRQNDTGVVLVKASPKNLSIELENEYVDGIDAKINCTAVVDPNSTVVFLIGKGVVGAMPIVAPTTATQRIVEQSDNDNCNSQVRVVYQADFTFLKDNNILACMIYDVDYNRNYTSEFRTANVIIIT